MRCGGLSANYPRAMTNPRSLLQSGDIDLPEWRWLLNALRARFATGSFEAGVDFIADVCRVAERLGHHPDVSLRYGHVQFVLRSHDVDGVTSRDVDLAREISRVAGERGIAAEPGRVQVLELALDTPDVGAVRPFWAAVLGGDPRSGDVIDPDGAFPPLWFQDTASTLPDRQRFHLDVTVPAEVAEVRIAAAVAAGGRLVDTSHAPAFTVLADADDNLACICTEEGRE